MESFKISCLIYIHFIGTCRQQPFLLTKLVCAVNNAEQHEPKHTERKLLNRIRATITLDPKETQNSVKCAKHEKSVLFLKQFRRFSPTKITHTFTKKIENYFYETTTKNYWLYVGTARRRGDLFSLDISGLENRIV